MLFLPGSAQGLHKGRNTLHHLCLGRGAGGRKESCGGSWDGLAQLHIGRCGCSRESCCLGLVRPRPPQQENIESSSWDHNELYFYHSANSSAKNWVLRWFSLPQEKPAKAENIIFLYNCHILTDSSIVLSTPTDYMDFKLHMHLLSLGEPSKPSLTWMLGQSPEDLWRCSLQVPILLLHLLRIQSEGCRGDGGPVPVLDLSTLLREWEQSYPYKDYFMKYILTLDDSVTLFKSEVHSSVVVPAWMKLVREGGIMFWQELYKSVLNGVKPIGLNLSMWFALVSLAYWREI